jgi:hypothetical protein
MADTSLGTIAASYIGTVLVENTNIGTTAQTGASSSGLLYQVYIDNTNNSAQVYLKVYDTTGSVTVGTTHPDFVFPCAASSIRQFNFPEGIGFADGFKFACETDAGTGDGSAAAPGAAVVVRISLG